MLPRLLKSDGTASGSGPGYRTVGDSYQAVVSAGGGLASADLQIGVLSTGPHSSVIRVDAVVVWLDPRPEHDTTVGPRMRVTLAGCPATDRGDVGVNNPGNPILDRQLLPEGEPSAGLLCAYYGMNTYPFHLKQRVNLSTAAARRIAAAINQVELSHTDGGYFSCPMDDGAAAVLVLAYPHLGEVDLFGGLGGCSFVSNGHVRARASLATLADISH